MLFSENCHLLLFFIYPTSFFADKLIYRRVWHENRSADNKVSVYSRTVYRGKHSWNCTTFQTEGKTVCAAKKIPEETLKALTCEVLGLEIIDANAVRSRIAEIRAEKNNVVVFCMDDGSEIVKRWKYRSRAESWTPEMKEKARQQAQQARRNRK